MMLSQEQFAGSVQFDAQDSNTFTNVEHQIRINVADESFCAEAKFNDAHYTQADLQAMDQYSGDRGGARHFILFN